jgi:hypothetical protein
MTNHIHEINPDEALRNIGPDAAAIFDKLGNPTQHANLDTLYAVIEEDEEEDEDEDMEDDDLDEDDVEDEDDLEDDEDEDEDIEYDDDEDDEDEEDEDELVDEV